MKDEPGSGGCAWLAGGNLVQGLCLALEQGLLTQDSLSTHPSQSWQQWGPVEQLDGPG